MMAGAVAGMGEHIAMFPVDTIKTRMQALSHPGQQVRRWTTYGVVSMCAEVWPHKAPPCVLDAYIYVCLYERVQK